MSVLVAKVGRSGAGGANSNYITRLSAAGKIAFHNLEHLESEKITEARTNAIAYAHAREEIELAKAGTRQIGNTSIPKEDNEATEELEGSAVSPASADLQDTTGTTKWKPAGKLILGREIVRGSTTKVSTTADEENTATVEKAAEKPKKPRQVRTHYRLIASWEGKETSENAAAEVKIYLERQFPKARAIIAVHQDTDDTHAHVWIDARQTDGKKIHLKDKQFESLDEKWTEQYDRTYGTNYAPEYKALKEETKQWKREMYQWRKSPAENQAENQTENAENIQNIERARLTAPPLKPQRAADRFKANYWKEKEIQQITGVPIYEQINAGADHSDAQRANRYTEASDSFTRTGNGFTETEGKFTRRAEFINQGAEHDDRRTQQKSDGNEQFTDRAKSDFSGAAQDGAEFVQSDERHHQSSESGRTGFTQSQTQYSFDTDQSNVYFQGTRGITERFTTSQISQEQLYEDRIGFGSTDGSGVTGSNQEDLFRNSTVGKFNIELNQIPEIQFQMPEIQMDSQTMVKDTLQMIQTSLERQRIRMDGGATDLYRQHLNYIANLEPAPFLLKKIDQFNQNATEDKFIKTEDKSWLEANHEYLSSLSTQKLDREANNVAETFEEDLKQEQKLDPNYQEREGMTLSM